MTVKKSGDGGGPSLSSQCNLDFMGVLVLEKRICVSRGWTYIFDSHPHIDSTGKSLVMLTGWMPTDHVALAKLMFDALCFVTFF